MSEGKNRVVWLKKKGLRRVLGVGDLFGVGFGDVGSSIYYALGATALFALGATPLALMIAGFVFICTAFSYAELAATFPEPGGSATYTRHAFNDLISFIAGWGLLLDYIVTMAISAFTIPPYFNQFLISFGLGFGDSTFAHLFTAILLLVGLYFINLIGMRQSGRMTFLLAVLTAVSQLAVIVFGLFFVMHFPTVLSHIKIGAPFDWSPSLSDFLKGTAVAMVAYTGIEAIAQLAGETKKPQVTIPRAIKLTVTILVIMYLGIISVGLSVITPKELGTTYLDNPIVGIVSHFPGSAFLVPAFGLVAALILLIASNAGLLGCSRLAFSLGEYYQVPSFFYKIHSKYRTPYVSLAFFTVLGCIILIASRGQMLFLVDLYNIGAQIAFFSTHIALIVLRIKKPELERPYR
ncbi:MAG TPA: APC family permease, partial [Chlamydiales bacterium]|nr:APC family permease [Chlamydiales bacterium]